MNPGGNRALFERLAARGLIRCARGPIFDTAPAAIGGPGLWDRVEGMMLGLAVGDSLGNSSESLTPQERRRRHGEVRDYLPSRAAPAGERPPRGYPSDDTQLAFWTLERLLEDRGLDPERLASTFVSRRIYGMGSSVREFIRNHRDQGKPWYASGPQSAGNGALMRIAPVLLPWIRRRSSDLWVDAALCAMITHNDWASTSACVAMVSMLWSLLGMERPPEPSWWVQAYVDAARGLEGSEIYRPRVPRYADYEGTLSRFVELRLAEAWDRGLTTLEACESWHSGAYLLETVPCVLYILMRHAADPEEAIVRAVNDTHDNDTAAAVVGALVGALHGRSAIPHRWIDRLSGRTQADDDGRVFRLLQAARAAWG